MRPIPFAKVQSVGNDFVLIEQDQLDPSAYSDFAEAVCQRHFSVGSDGLLVVGMEGHRLMLRMFNPDGTEDFCGNGLRCAARYAFDRGWTPKRFQICHLDRLVMAEVSGTSVSTEIGAASFNPSDVPHLAGDELFLTPINVEGLKVELSALTTGSTHAVILVEKLPSDDELAYLGPRLEHHPLFPERTSVIWARPLSDESIEIRIWERGAGETMGCGTGSSAAATVIFRQRDRAGSLEVRNPGGVVKVHAESWTQPITIEGIAETVFAGRVPF